MPGTPAASACGQAAMQVHASIASFTQFGIGAVRTRPCMPTRSTMHQRPSRCWIWAKFNAATSDRRSPQPRRTAMIARSRSPSVVVVSGALSKAWACRSDSQFPVRMPCVFALFTRAMPVASSGASRPLSAASAASLRMADMRMIIDEDPSLRSSKSPRTCAPVEVLCPPVLSLQVP